MKNLRRAGDQRALEPLLAAGSPFELLTEAGSAPEFRNAPRNLAEIVVRAKRRADAKDSCLFVVGGIEHSSRAVFAQVARLVEILGQGIPDGHEYPRRIAVVLPSGAAWIEAFLAIVSFGGTAVLVPYSDDEREMAQRISMTASAVVITLQRNVPGLMQLTQCHFISADASASGEVDWVGRFRSDGRAAGMGEPKGQDAALIAFTSGSSGAPKSVVLSHQGVVTGIWNMMLASAWAARRNAALASAPSRVAGSPSATLVIGPLSHVGGYAQLLLTLTGGGKLVLLAHWEASTVADLLVAQNIRALAGANALMIRQLLSEYQHRGVTPPLDAISMHGSALLPSLIRTIRDAVPGVRLGTSYGMTETNGAIAASSGEEFLADPSCGPVVPTAAISIVNDAGTPVLDGEVGEVQIRGRMLFAGYCDANGRLVPREDHWHRTGDTGFIGADGRLRILERSGDRLRFRHRAIPRHEIERVVDGRGWGIESLAIELDQGSRCLIAIALEHPVSDAQGSWHSVLVEELGVEPEEIVIFCSSEMPRTTSGKLHPVRIVEAWTARQAEGGFNDGRQ